MKTKIEAPKEYQEMAARTMNKELTEDQTSAMLAMGLSGEAGEVTDYLKKVLFHDHIFEDDRLEKELGDVLWYVANLCTHYGYSLEDIMEKNIRKLFLRYPEGFSAEKSITRENEGEKQ